jgi:EAL domain-containing protein (putative c-di-GMP-specific phosphodiesterase class I)
VLERLELKTDLQAAIDRQEFILQYQPIMILDTGEVSGVEALVRWQHPERGVVPPNDFISLAEDTGLIVPLGKWILETACKEARRLQDACPREPALTMSVNLSARQLQRPDIVEEVKGALEGAGLSANSLVIEITESVMMQDMDLSILRLHELKELGVRIAVDDFGTGYSSLNYIRRFPLDVLKVDKSFIDVINNGGEESALTAAIIDLAQILSLRPVAEGIEEAVQFERLVGLGCELGQGYYFAKPLPGDAIHEFVAQAARASAGARHA